MLFRLCPRCDEAVSPVTAVQDLSRHSENINLGQVTKTTSKHHITKETYVSLLDDPRGRRMARAYDILSHFITKCFEDTAKNILHLTCRKIGSFVSALYLLDFKS